MPTPEKAHSSHKITESPSPYSNFSSQTIPERVAIFIKEDKAIGESVEKCQPQITELIKKTAEQLNKGHRLFYIGAGTSGRLGVLDASELPPTFGVMDDLVIAIIAGGDKALRYAVEGAEDDRQQGWLDLQKHNIGVGDVVIGITTSGTTPYVTAALQKCRENDIITGSITCNTNTPAETLSDYPVVCPVGPEVITGSTRLKAGTATKQILNNISSNVMVELGLIEGNDMVNMRPSNEKLFERGTTMIMKRGEVSEIQARHLLKKYGNVQEALKKIAQT